MKRINFFGRTARRPWPLVKSLVQVAQIQPVIREFDETTDDEIEALAASVGASGARRPPSE